MRSENYKQNSLRRQRTIRGDLDKRVANVKHGKHKGPSVVVRDSLVRNVGSELDLEFGFITTNEVLVESWQNVCVRTVIE